MSSLAVFEVAMWVNVYDKSSLKIRKKRKYGIKEIFT